MLENFEKIPAQERIIVALDCDVDTAFDLADRLQGRATWLKVGMTLYYAQGPAIVYALKERGFKVFLDLKFHDIPHQVRGAAASAVRNGADMLTMHAQGGIAMMQAAREGCCEAAAGFGVPEPILLGITVLTSMDQAALTAAGITRPLPEQVEALADQARQAGLSGVVASPREAHALRNILGPDACIVTPGVRPAGSSLDDQSRVATPAQAFEDGASHLVIGRPITQAEDPARAFDTIVKGLHA